VAGRKASREAEGKAGRKAGRQAGRKAGRKAGRRAGMQADRQTDRQLYSKTDVQIHIQTNKNKDILTYTDMHRQRERQTDRTKVQDGRKTNKQMYI
jgi:hypothetical protein